MPRSTPKLRPIIVYVPVDEYKEIEKQADEQDRSMSYIARGLVHDALASQSSATAQS